MESKELFVFIRECAVGGDAFPPGETGPVQFYSWDFHTLGFGSIGGQKASLEWNWQGKTWKELKLENPV